ncbi:MAG TPA: transglycosylase SLT domain-containing protein [Steroidobacteraceae bacterium]|nr:transglycosylase SLT domain-containing protein [Steroidobacteraceae bacterium]
MLHRLRLSLLTLLPLFSACHALAAERPTEPTAAPAAAIVATSSNPLQSRVRQEFIAAMQRVRRHEPEPADSPELESYVIHDYLVAARLERDLELRPGEELDAQMDAFLKDHAGQPVSRALRGEWLGSLATRGRWDWFLARDSDLSSPALLCDHLAGELATGEVHSLPAEALARWSLPQRQPAECDPVFAWLRTQGLLTPARAEARARAALAAENPKLARESILELPPAQAAPLLQWAQLLESPKSTLALLAADPSRPVEGPALEAGFTRLSRSDSGAALGVLPGLLARPDLTPELRTRLRRLAALGAAYDRDPAALDAFRALPPEVIDDDVQEWRVRAALWAADYDTALQWMDQMPSTLSRQPRWRYWRARVTAATVSPAAAAPLYGEIAGLRDFYGYLAADRLHMSYALNARASADDPGIQSELAARPGMIRARALFDCNMTDEAIVEWAAALGNAEPSLRLQAAHLAASWGWYAQSISTLAQAGELDDVRLRYPRPYSAAVSAASKLTQLPPDWILAVMRQESLFRRDAVSRAGARGLMQMQPATATAVARRWHMLPPSKQPEGTYDPDPDVALGAAYLRELLDRYGNQLGPSLAAYNAGPIPVSRWLPGRPVDADVWIENIPYGETRNYVERIFEHIVAFAWVRAAQPPRLAALLPQVEPNTFYAQAGHP